MLQNKVAEEDLSSLANWIHLGSLDHLGQFCRWFGQVWEMCVIQVSCLWEQEHHLCIPAYSKTGPLFCCTITLAMHSRTDDALVYHEYLLLFCLYFMFHFHAKIWWVFVWFVLFSETDNMMKVMLLKVNCNSSARWRTNMGRFSGSAKECLPKHSALKGPLRVPEKHQRALPVGCSPEQGAKSFSSQSFPRKMSWLLPPVCLAQA